MGKQAIKIGILEDKEKEINILEDMLYDIAEENDIKIDIEFASQSWKDFMDNLQHYIINTCFLDIDLNTIEMNGMDVAEKIDEMDKGIKIIFITGHNQYMGNAFKVSAFDYLHKPLNKEDLRNTLIRLNAKLVKPVKCLEIYAQEYIRIPYRDIVYIIYEDRRVKIYTVNSVEILPSTFNFKSIISKLPSEQFIECNSNICVNMDYVKRFKGQEIEIDTTSIKSISDTFNINKKMYLSKSGTKRVREFIKSLARM